MLTVSLHVCARARPLCLPVCLSVCPSVCQLSATPSTVRQVVQEIQHKAKAPMADARSAGWEAKASEFLFFNLADKVRFCFFRAPLKV